MEAFLSNNSIDVLTSEFFGKFEQEIHRESSKVRKYMIAGVAAQLLDLKSRLTLNEPQLYQFRGQ